MVETLAFCRQAQTLIYLGRVGSPLHHGRVASLMVPCDARPDIERHWLASWLPRKPIGGDLAARFSDIASKAEKGRARLAVQAKLGIGQISDLVEARVRIDQTPHWSAKEPVTKDRSSGNIQHRVGSCTVASIARSLPLALPHVVVKRPSLANPSRANSPDAKCKP